MNIINPNTGRDFVTDAISFKAKFEKETMAVEQTCKEVLKEIIEINKNTQFGKGHNFSCIKDEEQYKSNVPLSVYSDFQSYVERMASGEENLLTSEAVVFFGLSSGTTGNQKLIPITERARKIRAMHMSLLTNGVLFEKFPQTQQFNKGLMMMSLSAVRKSKSGIPMGAGSSGNMRALQWLASITGTSPVEIFEEPNQQTANYIHLLFALKERDLLFLNAPLAPTLLALLHQLEHDWPSLIEDIRTGKIDRSIELTDQLRENLEHRIEPDEERAEELTKLFKEGFEQIAPKIWPKLLYVQCIAGGSFSVYIQKLQFYVGNTPIFTPAYNSTEALIGSCLWPGKQYYVLTPRTAYFEFIPTDNNAGIEALPIYKLELGNTYEIVLTNYCGLYRYRLGDVVKVVDFYHQCPVIEFQYRHGQLLNIAGEKSSEHAVFNALLETSMKLDCLLIDFTTTVNYDMHPGNYDFFVEIETTNNSYLTSFREILDESMKEANPIYKIMRDTGKINPINVKIVKNGTFEEFSKALRKKIGSKGPVKIPRLISDNTLICFLEESEIIK
ncbi:GH3 auxin-responsive promoter-binding protein [Desulfosporosinus acidiphilus SJ4]|uniref:GH3 auxin-responsive promoter-binding protein n=1 Tax=Desulfosporosinus acidiphilus (strain DSM 22704 / JCM 16185 / SJ4) TaxID=646529 RepID=I4DC57_DESAJ|nr:GH3 auxin-responsive promoter family protein [Desulfosporosinus acidiphilus]AFM43381.1 GH3 auxin-responsive promoter-binding protein [Desulfosporosinus acidiphilus SJ4]